MDEKATTLNRRQLGGVSIMLGNAALFANGLIAATKSTNPEIKKAGMGRMVSGALYLGVGGIIARYGNPSTKQQLDTIEDKLAAYLKAEGVPLDADALAHADHETQKSWFSKLEDFAYDHPIEVANVYNLLAASGMLVSGFERRKRGETTAGNANLASYAMLAAGMMVSVLTKELTPEQEKRTGRHHVGRGAEAAA